MFFLNYFDVVEDYSQFCLDKLDPCLVVFQHFMKRQEEVCHGLGVGIRTECSGGIELTHCPPGISAPSDSWFLVCCFQLFPLSSRQPLFPQQEVAFQYAIHVFAASIDHVFLTEMTGWLSFSSFCFSKTTITEYSSLRSCVTPTRAGVHLLRKTVGLSIFNN